MDKKRVCIVGAGVVGLTTAVEVATWEREVVEVTLISEQFSPHTTGDGSAGVIEPYLLGKTAESTIRTWVSRSVEVFESLRRSPEASLWGVDLLTLFQLFTERQPIPSCADVVIDWKEMTPKELAIFQDKYKFGHRVTTYVVECNKYLPMLLKRFQNLGGKVIQKRVESIDELAENFDVVINCCGIGAASLVQDPLLKPIRGQVAYVKAPWIRHGVITDKYYVFPHSDRVVCGGTSQVGDWNLEVDKNDSEDIWRKCTELFPSLQKAEVLREWVGLRPGRPCPRIERETLRTARGDIEVNRLLSISTVKINMEVVVYGAITTIWWMSSMSVLLPFLLLLKFSKFFRDRWFSFLFMKVLGPVFGPVMLPIRKKTFTFLERHLSGRDKSKRLEVLEIGIGGGANLQFYPENCSLTALDMNESFEKYFLENQKKHPQVKYARTVVGMAENMTEVEDSSMDLVICTYVLCSVQEIGQALLEVKRVLKPDGKFLFLEHVAFPKTQWGNTVQNIVAPLWKIYFDGCMPHRDIAQEIRGAGFANVEVETAYPSNMMLFTRPMIMGIATK